MADTGFVFPGTGVGNRTITGGDVNWTNPAITGDDGDNAFWNTSSQPEQSNGLAGSNFDFSSIPAGSTIDGIEVQVGDYESGGANTWEVLRLILADTTDGSVSKHADLLAITGSLQTDEAGGASDLWSETIGRTDVQDSDWGFFVGQEATEDFQSSSIDFFKMKVYYTLKPIITDVNTTESWNDGDTGLVITGSLFV